MKQRIIINEEARDLGLIRPIIADYTENGTTEAAEMLCNGKRNKIYKKDVGNGHWITIKCFRVPNLLNSIVYSLFRKSKARRSYEYALRLNRLGILSPTPIAYVENKRGILLKESYYLCDYAEGPTILRWEERPDADVLLDALAKDMLKMHQQGVWHKDFSPGNIIVQGNAKDGYTLYHIDLNRMKFDVHDPKKLMMNFRCVNLKEEETRRLARHYAHAAGLDEKATEDEAARLLQEYLRKKARHNRLKKYLKKVFG